MDISNAWYVNAILFSEGELAILLGHFEPKKKFEDSGIIHIGRMFKQK